MASALLQPSRVFQVEHPWWLGRQVLRAGPVSGPLFPSPSSSLLTALGLQLSCWPRSPVVYDTAPPRQRPDNPQSLSDADKALGPLLLSSGGLSASPSVLPSSSGSAALTCIGPSRPPQGSPQPLPQAASIPNSAAAAPAAHLVPTHTGWVMYTPCADVRGGVRIHMGYRSYIHCAYIYIYSIYIYLFTFIYILYRTLTFYQKHFCDFHVWPHL